MKVNLILTLILVFIMVFFPFVALSGSKNSNNTRENTTAEITESTITQPVTEEAETVKVLSAATGTVTEMSIEDYIYGTLCAEMPASFHREALKAQAVACYTYMKWIKENSDNPEKFKADITDSSETHQAFMTDSELKEKWGTSYDIYADKMRTIVKDVLYEYLKYENETAMTLYHGISPGETQNSEKIMTGKVSYLRSVTAPGDKLSPDYISVKKVSSKDFVACFEGEEKDLSSLIKSIKKDGDGFFSELTFNNKTFSPSDLRSMFSLKSPYFEIKEEKDNIVLTVYGKGHGIGMSQYSADYMARQGSTYEEILAHFYTGTTLVKP